MPTRATAASTRAAPVPAAAAAAEEEEDEDEDADCDPSGPFGPSTPSVHSSSIPSAPTDDCDPLGVEFDPLEDPLELDGLRTASSTTPISPTVWSRVGAACGPVVVRRRE